MKSREELIAEKVAVGLPAEDAAKVADCQIAHDIALGLREGIAPGGEGTEQKSPEDQKPETRKKTTK